MYIYLSFKTSTRIWLLWLILTVRQAQAVHLSFSTFAHWQHLSMVDPKKIGQIWKSDLLCYLFSRVPLSNCIVQCVHVSYCFHSLPNPKKKLWWTWPKEARIRQNTIRGFSGTGALKEAFLAPWPLTLSLSDLFSPRLSGKTPPWGFERSCKCEGTKADSLSLRVHDREWPPMVFQKILLNQLARFFKSENRP
jgi:hypothetical protein